MSDSNPKSDMSTIDSSPVDVIEWWNSLEPQWQNAFVESGYVHRKETERIPEKGQLQNLLDARALRMAGPMAPYPNISFELTNMSGLREFRQLETLVITDHQITELNAISSLSALTALFVNNNQIQSLEGIETLTLLGSLYAHSNQIRDLLPLSKLKSLREIYIGDNALTSLEGLQAHHSETLHTFVCLPNQNLPQREIIRVENYLGIRCK
jgi:Leucine-rich repeat (LRR) protein